LHDCKDLSPGTTGPDLAADLLQKAMDASAELAIGTATALSHEQLWTVTSDADTYSARAVILASGLKPGKLGLLGEEKFEGRGMSHCAACDGPLYAGKPVVVVGDDRWAVQEAVDLTVTASAVTLITPDEPSVAPPGISMITGRITGLRGEMVLEAVLVETGGETRNVPAHGLFVQCSRASSLDFAPQDLAQDGTGRVCADKTLQCNLPLLFVAGSVRSGAEATIMAAATDGRMAASAVVQALRSFRAG
jgi:thioredoxin reductase (NADPH)